MHRSGASRSFFVHCREISVAYLVVRYVVSFQLTEQKACGLDIEQAGIIDSEAESFNHVPPRVTLR